ncbi:hypothetical protein IPC367_29275 [Pseudomonas aeruginosa]|uniref:Uncharacterized protein n=1 Tax=Pseudomonas aeruginosa TaxID=287 RepID=A0A6B1YFQ2_PSEAI|nr:hypothetical protein [Pseudomonas aeruginosa]EIU3495207.1 hypothetical protein [Pseudomonas aeruginosa]MBM2763923.1 hypothetical protein [Pseudomonas aeruginosa]MBW6364323.1 hypothetical protein [Pseudomonas aeruginosa]MCE2610470.1 hypothetical protein [Pseudomonas aeruginosa]MCE2629571.1 hypothetical protein [Pseudomonas aeruginosa]
MAALNVTQTGMTAGAQRFLSVVEIPAELEKISCWFGGCSQANPFDFFGKRIRVGEQVQSHYGDDRGFVDESIVYEAKVIAVQVGSVADGVETSLLLKQDGYSSDFVEVSRLTVLEVLQ